MIVRDGILPLIVASTRFDDDAAPCVSTNARASARHIAAMTRHSPMEYRGASREMIFAISRENGLSSPVGLEADFVIFWPLHCCFGFMSRCAIMLAENYCIAIVTDDVGRLRDKPPANAAPGLPAQRDDARACRIAPLLKAARPRPVAGGVDDAIDNGGATIIYHRCYCCLHAITYFGPAAASQPVSACEKTMMQARSPLFDIMKNGLILTILHGCAADPLMAVLPIISRAGAPSKILRRDAASNRIILMLKSAATSRQPSIAEARALDVSTNLGLIGVLA